MSELTEFERKRAKKEIKATNLRKRLINEISTEEMIEIMFTHFIESTRPNDVIEIGQKYLTF